MPNLVSLALLVSEMYVFKKGTVGKTWLLMMIKNIYTLWGLSHLLLLLRIFAQTL